MLLMLCGGHRGVVLERTILHVILCYLGVTVIGMLSDPCVELGPCAQGTRDKIN